MTDPTQDARRAFLSIVRESGKDEWKSKLLAKRNGEPIPHVENAVVALTESPEWRNVLAYNEFTLDVEAKREPITGGSVGHWTDADDIRVACWLQRLGINVGKDLAGQAVLVVAHRAPYHPVRDWLKSLQWDGKSRVDYLFSNYFGVQPRPDHDPQKYLRYLVAVARAYLCSAIARVSKPGTKADHVLILEGSQGIGKSSALRALGEPWFTDEIADLGSKDAAMQLRGVWMVELAELSSVHRSETDRVKAFVSRQCDRYRPPYGRHLVEAPRQCVFAGTTNQEQWGRDDTGGRRFWPVYCGKGIDVPAIVRDKDQIWAEAYQMYLNGEATYLVDPTVVDVALGEQERREQADEWVTIIEEWIQTRQNLSPGITVSEVLSECIKKERHQWHQLDMNRVARCLRKLGYERRQIRQNGRREWCYFNSGDESGDSQ